MHLRTKVDVTPELAQHDLAGCDIVRTLDADPRFRRDSFLGGIFHPGRICFREVSPTDSLHVIVAGQRISAHVDEVSPLVLGRDGSYRYAWGRVVAHNLLALIADLSCRLRGGPARGRCNLDCEVEWYEDGVEAA